MPDWLWVLLRALPWVLGLALILADSSRQAYRRRFAPARAGPSLAPDVGLCLVALGLLLAARSPLERAAWGAIAALSLGLLGWQVAAARRGAGAAPAPPPASPPSASPVWSTRSVWAELAVVALGAPWLLFPERVPWLAAGALLSLLVCWGLIAWREGRLWPRTPYDRALVVLLLMCVVGVLVSAVPELTMPKAAALVLGLALYRLVLRYSRTERRLQLALAALLLLGLGFCAVGFAFGELRAEKIPPIAALRAQLPHLEGALPGAQGGRVSTNQLGGTLLWLVPLALGPALSPGSQRRWAWAVGALLFGGALLLTQSRGAWLGGALGVAAMLAVRARWLRRPMLALLLVALGVSVLHHDALRQVAATHLQGDSRLASPHTFLWRIGVWERSVGYLQDVPFTGYGLGTFRAVDTLFYGPGMVGSADSAQAVDAVVDVGVPHAHNVFLQMGYDLGILGLVAYLALLLLAAQMSWRLERAGWGAARGIGLGAIGALVGYHAFGLVDTVALGAKPGILWWGLLAIVAAGHALQMGSDGRKESTQPRDKAPVDAQVGGH